MQEDCSLLSCRNTQTIHHWTFNFKVCGNIKEMFSKQTHQFHYLTHWGRVTHICVSKLTSVGSDNGLLPGRHQAIIWTNAGTLLIGLLGSNFSENPYIFIQENAFENGIWKMTSILTRPQCVKAMMRDKGWPPKTVRQIDLLVVQTLPWDLCHLKSICKCHIMQKGLAGYKHKLRKRKIESGYLKHVASTAYSRSVSHTHMMDMIITTNWFCMLFLDWIGVLFACCTIASLILE